MKHRFTVLDVFRGIFASLVVFFHMSAFSDTPVLNNAFVENADLFVDFFFVLSGFVICYSYPTIPDEQKMFGFLYKRLIRLYPLHLLMLLIFLGIEGIKHILAGHIQINNSLDNSSTTFLTSLFLVNSIQFPGVKDISWNMVSWSISAELISYLIFAVSCFLLSKCGLNKLKPLMYLFIALMSVIFIFIFTSDTSFNYTYNYGFLRGLIGFFTGTLCFYAFHHTYERSKKVPQLAFSILEVMAVLGVGFMVVNGKMLRSWGLLFETAFFVSVYIFAFQRGHLSLLLSRIKPLERMGKYSYSIYMVHTLLISIFNVIFIRIVKLPPSAYSYLFIINYAIIFFVAAWTYQHVEMRFQQMFRSKRK